MAVVFLAWTSLFTVVGGGLARPLFAVSTQIEPPAGGSVDSRPDLGADPPSDTFGDPGAGVLLRQARAHRDNVDQSIVSYQAVVKQRVGAQIRLPLKDRTVYRHEVASRVWWSRDGPLVVRALAARQETPVGVVPPEESVELFDEFYDPSEDRIYFGLNSSDDGDEDAGFYLEHPFAHGSESFYRFESGDTITLGFPDGRRLTVTELRVLPRYASIHLLTGSFWVVPESGALVRAAYRLSTDVDVIEDLIAVSDEDGDEASIPFFLKPLKFSINLITVEYSLWDFKYWMPRSMRFEGEIRAGPLRAPGVMDLSYQIEEVVGADDAPDFTAADALNRAEEIIEEWISDGAVEKTWILPEEEAARGTRAARRARRRRGNEGDRRMFLLIPENPDDLLTSEVLPPPIWEEAPGFTSEADIRDAFDLLAELPAAPIADPRTRFYWGLGRADLVRFNRVEGLAIGAQAVRTTNTVFGPANLTATGYVGTANLDLSAELGIGWDGVKRAVGFSVYRQLVAVDEDARHLGMGNSLLALVFGRDDGEYFRASGASFTWRPASARRQWFSWSVYAERQESVMRNTNASLPRLFNTDRTFRENIQADDADQYGSGLVLRPYWGSQVRGWQAGVELALRGEVGDYDFGTAKVTLRSVVPLGRKFRVALEAAAGSAWGGVPVQRFWYLGGSRSLRGYEGSSAVGQNFTRARAELARVFPIVAVTVFGDAGWAGAWQDFREEDFLYSVGIGGSLLDGLVRMDIARALRAPTGWRLELYVDGII